MYPVPSSQLQQGEKADGVPHQDAFGGAGVEIPQHSKLKTMTSHRGSSLGAPGPGPGPEPGRPIR